MAICATTILQEEVDDAYRGRVFAFYDMMFNVTYAAGAALSAAFMPANGHSPAIVAGWRRGTRSSPRRTGCPGAGQSVRPVAGLRPRLGPGSGRGTAMPSPAAQRSSS